MRRSSNASGYIGVTLSRGKRYQAYIHNNGKRQYLDMYDTAKQAAKAYDAAAIELGRALSKLNFPKKVPPGYTPINNGQRSDNTTGYRGVYNKGKYGYMKHRSILRANSNLLATSTHANKLLSRTIMLFTNIAYQPRG
jgi:hypothetical protein